MSTLGPQVLTVGSFQKHLIARKQKKAKTRRLMTAGLTLTSMVDMFSLLVIFLLQTFSTSPELITVSKNVHLPIAVSASTFRDAPVLAVTAEEIYVDQKLVGRTDDLLKNPQALLDRLTELRELWQRAHPHDEFGGHISLQADKDLSGAIVSRLMGILPSQAYSTVQLTVISRGGS